MTSEQPSGGNVAPDQPMAAMAALLEQESAAYPELRRGEIVEGVVVGTDRDGILVDIGAKSEGVVPPHEMHCLQPEGPSRLRPGDKVLVFIVQPESQEGQIILSLDRARGERGWRVLQDYLDANQSFEAYVTGSNKGGLLVNVEGVNAFVPLSQIVAGPERGSPEATQRALSEWVGKSITLKVIELNRRRNRAILSERAAVQERRAADKERLLQELQEGDIRTGRVTSIRDFGIFVDIGGADGLVHLSELSWERTPKSPHELFKVGDEVPVYVLKVDTESKKIALSVRRAQPERWEEIVSRYREGQVVPGQITKLAPFGAFVRLEGPIEGLIHISELVDRRINHPKEVVQEGDVVPVKIVRIEYDRHRLGLSLRQARSAAEDEGWTFDEFGGPKDIPQDALDRLGLAAAPSRAPAPEIAAEAAAEEPAAAEAETAAEASPLAEPEPVQPAAATEVEVQDELPSQAEAPVAEAGPEQPELGPEQPEETGQPEIEAPEAQLEAPAVEAEPEPVPEATAELEPEAPQAEYEASEISVEPQADAELEPVAEIAAGISPEETALATEAVTASAATAEEGSTEAALQPQTQNDTQAEGTELAGSVEESAMVEAPAVTEGAPEALNKADEE